MTGKNQPTQKNSTESRGSPVPLRTYQSTLAADAEAAWAAGHKNVLVVLPTGAGKTVLFSHLMARSDRMSVAIAHRAELVGQISMALARNGVRHRVIAPDALRGEIEQLQMLEFGRRYIDQQAPVAVAGVNTLVRRAPDWLAKVGLWVVDEAHHLVAGNVWGKAIALMPNARGLGVTATPLRADGKGLGRRADGVMDVMLVGPTMRQLIGYGFLCDYRIYAPPNSLDLSSVAVGSGGEYQAEQLRGAVRRARLMGDTVQHYLRLAPGKLGITFCVDVETSVETCAAYRAAGVPAEVLTGETPAVLRAAIMRRFRAREILQLVNCDLLGEGTDVPAVEVVAFDRPTMSYGLYVQQFGRALRPLPGKSHAIIIDHAGNVGRHGLPDARREWTLDRRERRSKGGPADVMPVSTCGQCAAVYERFYPACPFCGFKAEPMGRSSPEQVDGDLVELDAGALARLRGDIDRVDTPWTAQPTDVVGAAMRKNHLVRQTAQGELRESMAVFGGWRDLFGESLSVQQRRFFLTFGVDVASAQALGKSKALELKRAIDETINKAHSAPTSTTGTAQ